MSVIPENSVFPNPVLPKTSVVFGGFKKLLEPDKCFIKPGFLLNIMFLNCKKVFNLFPKPRDSLKPNSLNPVSFVHLFLPVSCKANSCTVKSQYKNMYE